MSNWASEQSTTKCLASEEFKCLLANNVSLTHLALADTQAFLGEESEMIEFFKSLPPKLQSLEIVLSDNQPPLFYKCFCDCISDSALETLHLIVTFISFLSIFVESF